MVPIVMSLQAQKQERNDQYTFSSVCLALLLWILSLSLLGGCGLIAKLTKEERKPAAPQEKQQETDALPLPYEVRFEVAGADKQTRYLAEKMESLSQLQRLKKTPPDGELGLELRVNQDLKMAEKLLAAEGFYEGKASAHVSGVETKKAHVTLVLQPGPRYVVGDITIMYTPPPRIPEPIATKQEAIFPRTSIPGVTKGKAIVASDLLDKVSALPTAMHQNGFPDAKIVEENYYLDREKRTLNALIVIHPGMAATLGVAVFQGETAVDHDYLQRIVPWQAGEDLWDERKVDRYVNRLRRSGLFKSVSLVDIAGREGSQDKVGQKKVGIALEDAKHKSIGAMLRYDTDDGFGAEVTWEHRNALGAGEKFTAKLPYTATKKGLELELNKPAFLRNGQFLQLKASALEEQTDAYDSRGVMVGGGIVRRWTPNFSTITGLWGDVGSIKDDGETNDYKIYGLFLRGRHDTRNDRRNPSSGYDTMLTFKPLSGFYEGDFSALSSELSLSGYFTPLSTDDFVLATRIRLGSLTGAPMANIPPDQRFYLGGMDTIRGYGYQQVGPQDESDEPTGGRSYQLLNLEGRYRINENLGFVAFLDGGKLYQEEFPRFEGDMDWGAGVGVRYFTPIGPVRLDLAVPLEMNVNPPMQIYISIGQAF